MRLRFERAGVPPPLRLARMKLQRAAAWVDGPRNLPFTSIESVGARAPIPTTERIRRIIHVVHTSVRCGEVQAIAPAGKWGMFALEEG